MLFTRRRSQSKFAVNLRLIYEPVPLLLSYVGTCVLWPDTIL